MPARLKIRSQAVPDRLNAQARREHWPTLCDDRLVFDDARLNDLGVLWHAVRGGRVLPQRADFTARILLHHLRDILFVARVAASPRCYRFGFHGSGLARYTGDWTGKILEDAVPARFLASWYASYDAALEHGAPLRFVSHFRAFDLDYMTAETLLAPLGDADGAPCGLLVSVVYTPRVT